MDFQPMSEAAFYVLLALTREDHGYSVMQRIEKISHGNVIMGPGTLYGILSRLREWKLIELRKEDDRRKTYCITEKGREELRREYMRLKRMVSDGESEGI